MRRPRNLGQGLRPAPPPPPASEPWQNKTVVFSRDANGEHYEWCFMLVKDGQHYWLRQVEQINDGENTRISVKARFSARREADAAWQKLKDIHPQCTVEETFGNVTVELRRQDQGTYCPTLGHECNRGCSRSEFCQLGAEGQ